jgi:hypothetical protein
MISKEQKNLPVPKAINAQVCGIGNNRISWMGIEMGIR